jgi:hypothetical protein
VRGTGPGAPGGPATPAASASDDGAVRGVGGMDEVDEEEVMGPKVPAGLVMVERRRTMVRWLGGLVEVLGRGSQRRKVSRSQGEVRKAVLRGP